MASPEKEDQDCSQSEKTNATIENNEEDDDDVIIIESPKEPSIPIIELGDDLGVKEKEETLKKMDTIISHIGHNLRIVLRKLICDDCDTRVCPICHENFPNHLKHHIFYTDPSSFSCSFCEVSFRTACALKAHENLHKLVFPFVCPDCGAIYQQKKYFINHCLDRCNHLFKQARFICCACDCSFDNKLDHEKHMKNHIATKYYCRMCRGDLGTSKREALDHVKEKHDILLSPKAVTFGLDATTFCDICYQFKPHDHHKVHLDAPKTFFICPCGINCAPHLFRVHRNACTVGGTLPKYWKDILSLFMQKNNEKTKCTKCGDTLGINESCEECRDRRRKFIKRCLNCNRKRKTDFITNLCEKCSASINRSICKICACRFEDNDGQEICVACIEKRKLESSWLGAHTVIGVEKDDLFETRELTYEKNPPDHQYCVRQVFVSNLEAAKESCNKDLLVDSQNNDLSKGNANNSNTIMCHLCKQELSSPGNLLYKLLLHVKKYHTNAVIPTTVHVKVKNTDVDELDLMSRVKILDKKNLNNTEEIQTKDEETPRKRMRLFDPKSYKKNKTVPNNDLKAKEQKENNTETVSSDEHQTPPKKDYEFWDEVYEALSMVNKKDIPKSKKDVVYENLSGYSSKRQVKKPMRLVEQEVDKQQSLSRKIKNENDNELTTPEKSTDESDSNILEKKKRSRGIEEIDPELAKVKYKLKTDNELGFLAKTFNENTTQIPNKRKRKLASKLVYNEVIDVLNIQKKEACTNGSEYKCDICNVVVGSRPEFKQHWLTHEGEETPVKRLNGRSVLKRSAGPILNDSGKLYVLRTVRDNGGDSEKLTTMKNGGNDKDDLVGHKCKVCYQSFPSALELNKHFRIHGLAFLKQAQKDIKLA